MVGGLTTASSWIVFTVLLEYLDYLIAYAVAYLFGVCLSYILNVKFVFFEPVSLGQFIRYPLAYLLQFGGGVFIMWGLVDYLALAPELAAILVIVISTPITFLVSRMIIKGR